MIRTKKSDPMTTAGDLKAMKENIKRLFSYMATYRYRLSCAIILMIGFSIAMGILPTLMGTATDIITGKILKEIRTRWQRAAVILPLTVMKA